MKSLIVLLFMTAIASASADTLLKECKISCSSRCVDYAESLKSEANEVIEGCGSDSDGGELVEACAKVGFSYQTDIQKCVKAAGSADGVEACAAVGFSYQSNILTCITDLGSKDSDIVVA